MYEFPQIDKEDRERLILGSQFQDLLDRLKKPETKVVTFWLEGKQYAIKELKEASND